MAIIRKGDTKAESELRNRAEDMVDYRRGITPSEQMVRTKQRKSARDVLIDPKTGRASDLSPRYKRREYRGGGISGAAIAHVRSEETTVRSNPSFFSGVIKAGKLVKGGSGPLERGLLKSTNLSQTQFKGN